MRISLHLNQKKGRLMWAFFILFIITAVFYSYFVNSIITIAVLSSAIRQSTPLVLGAMCGLVGERAGIMNIGIEGQMLMAAFCGFIVNAWTGSLILATFAGML